MEVISLDLFAQPKPLGPVRLDGKEKLVFPDTDYVPGIYRFTITGSGGAASAYVGETMRLKQRFQHYRTPGPSQRTNIRLNERFRRTVESGGTVVVDVVLTATMSDALLDLTMKPDRMLIENAWLLLLRRQGVRLENA